MILLIIVGIILFSFITYIMYLEYNASKKQILDEPSCVVGFFCDTCCERYECNVLNKK